MNNKTLLGGAVILAVLVGGFFVLNNYIYSEKQGDSNIAQASYKDASYTIGEKEVRLVNGVSETEAAPGSASKITTRYFGNEAYGDLDGDGREDVVFILSQEPGGSGTFYYAVAALNKPGGYVGSHGLLLGDRIAPQSTQIDGVKAIVNYADRAPGESFATPPSVGKSIWLRLNTETMQFGEVVQNFEGEADPSRMTLGMKKWVWEGALINDGREITPKKPGAFTLVFESNGRLAATTDCNHLSGSYEVKGGGQIIFKDLIMTKMYCEGSQDVEFARMVGDSTEYRFTSTGKLILGIKFDSGTLSFR